MVFLLLPPGARDAPITLTSPDYTGAATGGQRGIKPVSTLALAGFALSTLRPSASLSAILDYSGGRFPFYGVPPGSPILGGGGGFGGTGGLSGMGGFSSSRQG